jgi:hypothetical protein
VTGRWCPEKQQQSQQTQKKTQKTIEEAKDGN